MMAEKLKPCPFCGGEASLCSTGFATKDNYYLIHCKGCGCKQLVSIHREKVIEAWNRRAGDSDETRRTDAD